MADTDNAQSTWLPVIGRALANLCLQEVLKREPAKYDSMLKRVKFLQGLGLNRNDAAEVAGSSPASVRELQSRQTRRKKRKNGKGKKKKAR